MSISASDIGMIIVSLSIVIFSAHLLGYLFDRLHQPRLVGEILAGIIIGPYVLGKVYPALELLLFGDKTLTIMEFLYWMGLLFLMFISGSETRRLLAPENRKATAWLLGVGTPLPFLIVLGLGLTGMLPLQSLTGRAASETAALLVLAIAVAVTSIPVISRIFHDLKILNTRFVSIILGSAVLEDIILWGVLAIATSLSNSQTLAERNLISHITGHVGITLVFTGVCLFIMPKLLMKLHRARWNFLINTSQVTYTIMILLAYTAIASILDVTLVFAAFLAGFGVVGGFQSAEYERFARPLRYIANFSLAVFVPVYFVIVGYKLVLGEGFSFPLLLMFLIGSTILSLLCVGLAAFLAGFRGLEVFNFAITLNARGGPGIVLASVAYDSGIINAAFYTTLVLTAVITSEMAGFWLRHILDKGWLLLSEKHSEV